jgi:HSP20 family protein
MTLQRRPSPFSELVTLRQAMDRLFDEPYFRPANGMSGEAGQLPLDVRSTKDALIVEAALPGVKPEDVDITIENGTLAIRGETSSERQEGEAETGRYLLREISRGSFVRTVSLPNGLEPDKAEATFDNGVLRLHIPIAEQVKPKQIRISPVSGGTATRTGEAGSTAGKGSSPVNADAASDATATGA